MEMVSSIYSNLSVVLFKIVLFKIETKLAKGYYKNQFRWRKSFLVIRQSTYLS